jgi:hypothetical protein
MQNSATEAGDRWVLLEPYQECSCRERTIDRLTRFPLVTQRIETGVGFHIKTSHRSLIKSSCKASLVAIAQAMRCSEWSCIRAGENEVNHVHERKSPTWHLVAPDHRTGMIDLSLCLLRTACLCPCLCPWAFPRVL